MSFGLQNSVIALTPTGRIDSEFPTGADGSDTKPVWTSNLPDLSQLQVGNPFSLDLAGSLQSQGALIDPGSPNSELGFNFVSGDAALAAGFSYAGTVLSNPCTLVTAGAFRLVAVRNGISVLSSPISFSISSLGGTDNVAPTIPTNIVAVQGSADNTISLSFDAPCDIAPGATPASGTAHVDLLINGTPSSPGPFVTPANALAQPVAVNIGSISSPAVPSFTQGGTAWTMSAGGTGIAATTSEQCLLEDFGAFSGARKVTARLNPYTSSAGTALIGLMVHETAAAGGRFIAIGLRPSNGTVGLYVITRTSPGGTSSQVATQLKDANGQSIVGPVYVAITRAADGKTFTVSYSLNQGGLILVTTQTIVMGTSVHIGPFCTSQSAGTAATGIVDEVAITSGTPVTATITAASAVSLQLRSIDANNNLSALSTTIQGIPKPPATAPSGLRQNYGIYGYFNYAGGVGNNRWTGGDKALMASTGPGDNLAGFAIHIYWRTVDIGTGTTAVYDWSCVDNYLASAKAVGKQLWVRWCEALINAGGGNTASGMRTVPTWVCNVLGGAQFAQANYNPADVAGGVMSKRYSAALVGYWIAFLKAFCDRYKNDPGMEGFTIYEETASDLDISGGSVTLATPGADYSEAGMLTQYLRIINAVRDPAQINCQTLNACMGMNYLFRTSDNQTAWNSVFTALIANKMGGQGPDTWLEAWTYPSLPTTNKNYPQQNAASPTNTPHSGNTGYYRALPSDNYYRGWYGGPDYRGRVLWAPDCEVTDMGGYITKTMNPVPTAADLFKVRGPSLDKCHYFMFDIIYSAMGYTGNGTGAFPGAGPAQEWHTGQYPWVKTAGPTNKVSPY